MNTGEHDRDHELWLAERLAYENESAEVREHLAACATCAQRYAELCEVAERLQGSAAERKRDLDRAATMAPSPGEEALESVLFELAASEPRVASRLRRLLPWLSAASILVVGALWLRTGGHGKSEPEPRTPIELGSGSDVVPLTPVGRTASRVFSWRDSTLAPGGYILEVYDAGSPPDALPVMREICLETVWTPDALQRAALPQRIRWRVLPREADGTELEPSQSVLAELEP